VLRSDLLSTATTEGMPLMSLVRFVWPIPVATLLLSGCATTLRARYDFEFAHAERTTDKVAPTPLTAPTTPARDSTFNVSDDSIELQVKPTAIALGVALENKTNAAVVILWDEAALVDPKGLAIRTMNTGVQSVPSHATLLSALVPPGSITRLNDTGLLPAAQPLSQSEETFSRRVQEVEGKQVKLLLPMMIGGVRTEYFVSATIKKAEVRHCADDDCNVPVTSVDEAPPKLVAPTQAYQPPH
jgi:hypothetical protein